MPSTGKFMLCEGFYSRTEVLALVHHESGGGTQALGFWMMLGAYDVAYPGYDIPKGARRMFGGKPRDVRLLLELGFLRESNAHWRLGYEGDLWSVIYSREGYRQPIPGSVRAIVMERDEYACVICSATDDLTLDHIIPWSHGGEDSVKNLRVLCRSCNSRRGNRVEVDA